MATDRDIDMNWVNHLSREEEPQPKPKPAPRHMKICFKHKTKQYGNFPCPKCLAETEYFKDRPRDVEDLKNGSIFAKHTGAWFVASGPGVRFGAKHDWYETFDIPSGVLKVIVDKLETKKVGS